jgi:16S rRNA (cytidine1402-2'-O)-methyltransferase
MNGLYILGTPIGNLEDISPRGLETLRMVDFIAAEDTRVTRKLLSRYDIHKPMVSYYEHNLKSRGQEIVARILAGESCAVVTDAGMPCISDPGELLVAQCAQAGIPVAAVPGPSAVTTALALSGLPAGRFVFEGFLTVNRTGRNRQLEALRTEERCLVFYEGPHKLLTTLRDMLAAFGDRRVALCREMTKLHEEGLRTTLSEAVARYGAEPARGEFVLVVEGAPPRTAPEATLEEAVALAARLATEGKKPAEAAREAAASSGYKKSEIYRELMNSAKKGETEC